MKKSIGLLWLLPVLIALLLPAAAGAETIVTTVDELLALCGTTIDEDVSLNGIFDLTGQPWTPIEEVSEGVVLDGSGATIIGLDVSATNAEGTHTGLVAVNKGTVCGMKIMLNADASAYAQYNGIIVGVNETDGYINDCSVCADPEAGEITITNTKTGGILGAFAGYNKGYITHCVASDLTFADQWGAHMGAIAGYNQYYIYSCFADGMKFIGNNEGTVIGGITATAMGDVETEEKSFVTFCTVTCSSISGKGRFMGGVAGQVSFGDILSNRVNYVDVINDDDEAYISYMGGIIGGLFDVSSDYASIVASNYYADNYLTGMSWGDNDVAGAIVGGYSVASSQSVFIRCFYCTDFCSAPMAGRNDGHEYSTTFDICDGVTKMDMTAPDWAEENLLSPWKNTGPDNYPVIDDRIPVSSTRLHRGNSYVPLTSARILWQGTDLTNVGLIEADTVLDPDDFDILNEANLPLELVYVTLNGQRLTEPVTAGDYSRLNFSAVVDNYFARDELQPVVDKGNELYDNGIGIYSIDTLTILREALDEAEAALRDYYLFIDEDWGWTLVDAIQNVEFDYFTYWVDLFGINANTYVNDSAEYYCGGFSGDTVRLNAIPDRGYKFICWKDSAGNVISEEPEFEYTISRDTYLEALAAPLEAYSFIYKDMYGKVYKTDAVTDYSQLEYPAEAGQAGLRTGYVVKEWQSTYPGILPTEGPVTQDVTFTAILEKADTLYTVEANAGDEVIVKQMKTAAVFRATAPDTYNDDDFSYWIDTDTGEIVSYSLNLSVSVYANMSFTAVYNGGCDDTTLVNLWTPNVEGSKIGFTAQVQTGLDFASEVMHGVLLLKSDEPVDEILFDTPGVIVGKSSGYSAYTKTFIINKKNVDPGDTWYGRAFIVYIDDGGARKVVYSDVKSATLP